MPIPVHIDGYDKPVYMPDGMSDEQIVEALEREVIPNLPKANGREERIAALRQSNPGEYDPSSPEFKAKNGIGPPNAWERFGHGSNQFWSGVGQFGLDVLGQSDAAKGLTDRTNDKDALYQAGRGPDAGFDWMSAAGGVAASAPLALLPGGAATTVAGRAAAGALAGGTAGMLQFDPENTVSNHLRNTGTGAAVGAVVAPVVGAVADRIAPAAKAIAGRIRGAMERVRGNATPQVILAQAPELAELAKADPQAFANLISEAQDMIAKTGTLDEAQIARKANLLLNDVQPTKAMVTRNPADWTLERNLQKLAQSPDEQIASTGQRLTDVYQRNDAALSNKLTDIGGKLPPGNAEQQGMTVMRTLEDLSKKSQADVGKVYQQVRDTVGDQLASDAKNLTTTLDDLRDNTYAEKLVSSVSNKLKRFGMLDKEGNLTANTLTVTQAEELRKFVNTLPNDFGKQQIIRSIDQDVLSGMGNDAFAGARSAAAKRFSMLDNPATQRALNTLGELQQGKTAQSFIKAQIIDAPEQDVEALVSALSKAPQKQQAQDALKAGLMEYLSEKSLKGPEGAQQFSGTSLAKAISDIGEKKLTLLVGAQKADQLKSLAKAAVDATYAPPFSAVNNSNTAPMLLSLTQKARSVPGVPLLVSEEAQKAAARSGYAGQLSEALKASPNGALPASEAAQQLARILGSSSAPVGVASATVMQEMRKRPAK